MARRLSSVLVGLLLATGLFTAPATNTPRTAAADGGPALGIIVDTTDNRGMQMAHEAGFTVAKMMLRWEAVEPSPGSFVWDGTKENDFDNIMKPVKAEGMSMIVRVDGVPGWAGGSPANANLDAVRDFYEHAARHGAGTVIGYEILNEPNLDREWGAAPNAGAYTAFLKAAYRGIKAGDPNALVIGGGPAPGTGNNPGATIEDVDFINGMYDAGAKDAMDALSVHNYGGNTAPETDPGDCSICFRRAERYRDVMVQRGDGGKQIWLTEWGYLLDAGQDMGQYDWMKVSADQQADFLVRAYRYAAANWPWLGGSLLYNIDGATSPYQNYGGFDAKAWFGILNSDYSPRPSYAALQGMLGQVTRTASPPRSSSGSSRGGSSSNRRPETPPEQPAPSEPVAQTDGAPADEPETAASPAPSSTVSLRVADTDGTGVNLRTEPSANAKVLKIVPEGAVITATGDVKQAEGLSWRPVRDSDGKQGWVAAKYVKPV